MLRLIGATLTSITLLAWSPEPGNAQSGPAAPPDTMSRWSSVAMGRLSARELGDVIATSLLGGLQGRMAGVRVIQPSGEPGSEIRLRLRGPVAISGSQDPLIIVDGSITRGSLADIAADDLDRIEVLKGPSASAIYGSDGAAGVVLVFTRRGRGGPEGKLQVRVHNEAGPSFMTGRVGESGANPFEIVTGSGGAIDFVRNNGDRIVKTDRIADNPFPSYQDHQSRLFTTGLFLANHLSAAWRKGPTNFAASFDNMRDEGTGFGLSGLQRRNLRLNLDQRVGPVEVSLSGFYGKSERQIAPAGLGPFFSVRFLEPYVDLLAANPDGSPYRAAMPDRLINASNPLYALANLENTAESERWLGGGTVRWRVTNWLALEGSYHAERNAVDSASVVPVGFLSASNPSGQSAGFARNTFFTGRSHTIGATLLATHDWRGVTSSTRVGYVYEGRTVDDSVATGNGSPPPTGSFSTSRADANIKSAFATTAFVFGDRFSVDAAARRDEMSFLSPDTRSQWYYRLAAAWRANQDLGIQSLDQLSLHAAYGTAGQRPGFASLLAPSLPSAAPLRAPRSAELEVGLGLATRGGRFTLDYAYSRKTTRDVIEVAGFPTPVGFIEEAVNAGSVRATTHELTLGYAVLRKPDLAWSLGLTGDRIRGRITEYTIPEALLGFEAQQPPLFLIGAGKELGVMYGTRFVRAIAELYDDPNKKALSGPGQAFDPASFVVNEEGYVVSRASWHCGEDHVYRDGRGACTVPERPIFYDAGACPANVSCPPGQIVPIGNTTPDFVIGLQSTLRYKRFGLSGLLDWSQGGDVYNGSRQWPFLGRRDPVFDQRGKPDAEKKSIDYYGAFYNSLNANACFVESGTYLKVREIAATYEFRLGRLDRVRVGLVGRNLSR